PVSATVAFGLVSRKLMLTVPPSATVAAPKDLAIVGGPTTVTVAVFDEAPAPVSFELIGPVVLFLTPAVAPVTVTVIVQLAPAARVPPVNVSVSPPVMTRLPPQVAVVPLGAVNPAGSVSVKATPVSATVAFGLVSRKLMLTSPPNGMLAAAKDFAIVGGATTVTVAVFDVAPAPDSVELLGPVVWLVPPSATVGAANAFAIVGGPMTVTVAVFDTAPAPDSFALIGPVVLFLTPTVAPVTVTVIVQLPPAANVPPVNVSMLPPAI